MGKGGWNLDFILFIPQIPGTHYILFMQINGILVIWLSVEEKKTSYFHAYLCQSVSCNKQDKSRVLVMAAASQLLLQGSSDYHLIHL